jgi:hypothetical protein
VSLRVRKKFDGSIRSKFEMEDQGAACLYSPYKIQTVGALRNGVSRMSGLEPWTPSADDNVRSGVLVVLATVYSRSHLIKGLLEPCDSSSLP